MLCLHSHQPTNLTASLALPAKLHSPAPLTVQPPLPLFESSINRWPPLCMNHNPYREDKLGSIEPRGQEQELGDSGILEPARVITVCMFNWIRKLYFELENVFFQAFIFSRLYFFMHQHRWMFFFNLVVKSVNACNNLPLVSCSNLLLRPDFLLQASKARARSGARAVQERNAPGFVQQGNLVKKKAWTCKQRIIWWGGM